MNRLWPALFAVLVMAHLALGQPSPPLPTPVPIRAQAFIPLEQPPWGDWLGHPAMAFTNVNTIPSWDYLETCLSIDTNVPAYLQEPVYESGRTNVTFATGSISVWFQANWTSAADGGSGPTNWATLLSIGHWTSNAAQSAWTIALSPAGTNLVMEAQSDGSNQVVFDAPIDFDAGDWHALTLSYTPTNCALYLEGEPVTNTAPINNYPSESDCAEYGLFVGSMSADGLDQCHGQLQWLTTYATALTAAQVAANYAVVSEYIAFFGGSLPSVGGFHPDLGSPPDPGGGWGTNSGGTNGGPQLIVMNWPSPVSPTNYAAYNQFCLNITNDATNAYVSVTNTLSNLTYAILTNGYLANPNGWGLWQVVWASNSITPAPPIPLVSNAPLFFEAVLVSQTGTNSLPDWWQMKYFGQLNVNPYADPDGDGLCNLDEYLLGTDPTNPYSRTTLHKDAAALILAFTNYDSNCTYQLFVTNGSGTNTVLVTMSPTLVGSNYQIYTHNQSDTNNTWIVETSFLGTNSATTVAITLNGRSLDFVGGYGEDSDGDGLPDGYEVISTWTDPYLPDTGITGVADGYKDPDGDGYSNLQEMYNLTNPRVFDTPYGPVNLVADYTDGGNQITFNWQPASGPVLGYAVYEFSASSEDWIFLANVPVTQLSFVLTNLSDYNGFGAVALYAGGYSSLNGGGVATHQVIGPSAIAHGPGGKCYLLAGLLNSNVAGFQLEFDYWAMAYPEVPVYNQTVTQYPDDSGYYYSTNSYVPITQFTNGVALLSDSQQAPFTLAEDVSLSAQIPGETNGGGNLSYAYFPFENVPFIDATAQMKQNVRFLLRVANGTSFSYSIAPDFPYGDGNYTINYASDYVYSTFYDTFQSFDPYSTGFYAVLNHFAPVEDNYFFYNFIFNPSLVDANGLPETGFHPWSVGSYFDDYYQYTPNSPNPYYAFPTFSYVATNNTSPIDGLLSSNDTPWVGYFSENLGDFGVNVTTSNVLEMSGNASNIYGLPYESLKITLSNSSGIYFATLAPGSNVPGYTDLAVYAGTAEPELQTVDYYFARPGVDPMPECNNDAFAITNTTAPLLLGSVGSPITIAGYAKQAVLNGYTNVFAYLGQYFTNALLMTNGTVTTTSAGIVSEYGEFFPTAPGHVALFTKPDPDQTNIQGRCELDMIRLSLDVNHDGTMDETFTGPDNTGWVPYTFWINNDYDRWVIDNLGTELSGEDILYENDVSSNSVAAESPFTPEGQSAPDYDYRDINGHRIIPCPRDLEDYARMWVSGISSNVLANLPSGSTVTLNWGDVGDPNTNNPTIDIFQAADADGGIGYLTNLTTASNQIDTNLCKYVGRLGPGSNIVLNSSSFSNNWAGDHFIWCGVSSGSGALSLTIADGSGNPLAQSSQTIQIQDIKQMYERWTVGDDDDNPPLAMVKPLTHATLVQDNAVPDQPAFLYSYDPAYDTNDTYILYVHGWNEPNWERDRWAETAYKRLYWQGYQGRFGLFRWPCYSFSVTDLSLYDESEWIAWRTGQSLNNFLARLNRKYPNNVYVLAHSQGNVVTGEALRLATNQIVNTYVASQAALSARAYDNTIPTNVTSYYSLTTPDVQGNYYTNGNPSYFNGSIGAGTYVNFFNPNDWALMGASLPSHPGWLKDQARKPEASEGYYYTTPTTLLPSGFYKHIGPVYGDDGATYLTNALLFPTNTYEIFAMCAQSYSLALGAQTGVGGAFRTNAQVSLSSSLYNFGSIHVDHDEQFVTDNMTTSQYWLKLLQTYGLKN